MRIEGLGVSLCPLLARSDYNKTLEAQCWFHLMQFVRFGGANGVEAEIRWIQHESDAQVSPNRHLRSPCTVGNLVLFEYNRFELSTYYCRRWRIQNETIRPSKCTTRVTFWSIRRNDASALKSRHFCCNLLLPQMFEDTRRAIRGFVTRWKGPRGLFHRKRTNLAPYGRFDA